jgi:hypothetical protein
MSKAGVDVLAERNRQVTHKTHLPDIDDHYQNFELIRAAIAYATSAGDGKHSARMWWPWNLTTFKPTEPRRDLVKAAALLIAEIDRLDRAAAKGVDQ